jgi:ketosteroid isomerase-like protein
MTDRARKLFYVGSVALVISSLAVLARPPRSQSHDQAYTEKGKDAKRQYTQVTVRVDRPSSNVDISSYVLITDDLESDRADAEAIMRVRTKLPLAVQTKDAALFDQILTRNFTFRAADEFWNREQYIRNRVGEAETVGLARYENLVLQLFGEVAVSTYRNVIQLKDASGKAGTLYMSWASVYVKERGEWKIGAVHLIDKKSDG